MKRILVIGFGALVPLVVVLTVLLTWHDGGEATPDSKERPGPQQVKHPTGSAQTVGNPARSEYFPTTTRDPSLAAFVGRNAEGRVSTDITSKIPRVRHAEDIPAVVSVLLDTKDDDTVRNEAANLLRRSEYSRLTDDLIKVLDNPKEGARFRAFCTQHLWMNVANAAQDERALIGLKLVGALGDRHTPVRREALLALVRMRDPKGEETAVEWLLDEMAEGVRDAAIRCVRELDLREHIPAIRRCLRNEDEVVRIAAIVTLSQWGDEESRPDMEEAAKSGSFRLRRCAEIALKRLDQAAKEKPVERPAKQAIIPLPDARPSEPPF